MPERILVALPCKLAPGVVSGERVFEVTLANGEKYRGVAPRYFCWNAQGKLVAPHEPAQEAPGFIAARIVDDLEGNQVTVEVPNGEVIAVDKQSVRERPSEIKPPTQGSPVES